ncbi:MAG: hypothetical protein JNL83_25025 [Myxococcales bacterium]|nr:hypothetical protein [Myxococcales bacterium]
MEPFTAVARPPSPLLDLLGLVPIIAALLALLVVPVAMFEAGRELSRHLTLDQSTLAIAGTGLVLNLARSCRCGGRHR